MISTWASLFERRELVREVTLAELRSRANESRFGVLWWMIDPLIMMTVYWAVIVQIFGRGEQYSPYPVFILCGMLPFKQIMSGITDSCKVLRSKGNLIKAVSFPTLVLPISTVITGFVYFLFGLAMLLVTALLTEQPMGWSLIQLPALMVLQIILVTGFSLAVAAFGVIFLDLPLLMTHIQRLLFYGCPILYGVDMVAERFNRGSLGGTAAADWIPTLYMANPAAILITGFRQAIFYGQVMALQHWVLLTVEAVVVFLIGYRIFQFYDQRVIKFL
jgi:ABC-type polysaccharide/polyol phosphate export permease